MDRWASGKSWSDDQNLHRAAILQSFVLASRVGEVASPLLCHYTTMTLFSNVTFTRVNSSFQLLIIIVINRLWRTIGLLEKWCSWTASSTPSSSRGKFATNLQSYKFSVNFLQHSMIILSLHMLLVNCGNFQCVNNRPSEVPPLCRWSSLDLKNWSYPPLPLIKSDYLQFPRHLMPQ